jgi:hypothetical protein
VRIRLRVIPRASKTAMNGVRDGRLLLRVTAPPVDGAANTAVVAALATMLEMPRTAVRVVEGATSRNKSVEIAGVSAALVRQRLGV